MPKVILKTERLLVEEEPTKVVLDGVEVTNLHVTIGDIMKAGHCVSGTNRWFDARGIDYRAFVRQGISASELLKGGDGFAILVVSKKLERENGR